MINLGAPNAEQLRRGRGKVPAGDQRDMGRVQHALAASRGGPGFFQGDEDVIAYLKYVADVGRGFTPGDNDRSALGSLGKRHGGGFYTVERK
jgi:hypothetical protein